LASQSHSTGVQYLGWHEPESREDGPVYGDGARYVRVCTHSTDYQASHEARRLGEDLVLLGELYPKCTSEELESCIHTSIDEIPGPELDG